MEEKELVKLDNYIDSGDFKPRKPSPILTLLKVGLILLPVITWGWFALSGDLAGGVLGNVVRFALALEGSMILWIATYPHNYLFVVDLRPIVIYVLCGVILIITAYRFYSLVALGIG